MYYIYLLECADNTIYTGITTDVPRRFEEHKIGKGAHYTRVHKALRILYTEEHPDRSSALKREAEIKKWSRSQKLKFITENVQIRRKPKK
jgi:putative endonuclease